MVLHPLLFHGERRHAMTGTDSSLKPLRIFGMVQSSVVIIRKQLQKSPATVKLFDTPPKTS
jgi:hypothetical protein